MNDNAPMKAGVRCWFAPPGRSGIEVTVVAPIDDDDDGARMWSIALPDGDVEIAFEDELDQMPATRPTIGSQGRDGAGGTTPS